MVEIREPRYKVGDKMNFTNHPGIFEVVEMINFNFCINDYFYKVKHMDFGEIFITNEANLEPYVEKPKTVWDLKEGDTYYSIYANGNVSSEKKWFDDDYENNYRSLGNCFLTKEEAETEVERRKIEAEMLRLGGTRKINELNSNIVYTIQMHFGLKYVYVRSFDIKQAPIGVIFFNYRKQAIKALETIGEDRIKKYLFGVDE